MYGPIADFRKRLNAGETLIGTAVTEVSSKSV